MKNPSLSFLVVSISLCASLAQAQGVPGRPGFQRPGAQPQQQQGVGQRPVIPGRQPIPQQPQPQRPQPQQPQPARPRPSPSPQPPVVQQPLPRPVPLIPVRGYCTRYAIQADPYANAKIRLCQQGEEQGLRAADNYASRKGRIDGYDFGYSNGLYDGKEDNRNDAESQRAGRLSADSLSWKASNAANAKAAEGSRDGNSAGESEAKRRFSEYVDTAQNPNGNPDARPNIPLVNYAGESNGFSKVGEVIPSEQDILSDLIKDAMDPYGNDYDRDYFDNMPIRHARDFWTNERPQRRDGSPIFDGNNAWNNWRGRDRAFNYGVIPLDPAGRPVFNGSAITQDAYFHAYQNGDRNSRFLYERTRDQYERIGRNLGYAHGILLGEKLSYYNGRKQAFDEMYQRQTRDAYVNSYKQQYPVGFQNQYNDQLRHPVLSVQLDSIRGNVEDGVLQPGERISATFTVKNTGGVVSPLTVSLGGNVQDALAPKNLNVGRLTKQSFTIEDIASTDANVVGHKEVRFTLNVNGIESSLGTTVRNIIEITSTNAVTEALAGTGRITVNVQNISTTPSSEVTVKAKLSSGQEVKQVLGVIAAGTPASSVLQLPVQDPFNILSGKLTATVEVVMNDRALDRSNVSFQSNDLEWDMAKYFDQLIRRTPGTIIPPPATMDSRYQEMFNLAVDYNNRETMDPALREDKNLWENTNTGTFVGKLLDLRKRAALTEEAIVRYEQFAIKVFCQRENLKNGFGWGDGARENFQATLRRLTRDGKDKTLEKPNKGICK